MIQPVASSACSALLYRVKNRTPHDSRFVLLALLLALPFLASSCHKTAAPAAKRYPFTGRVVSIDSQRQSAVIDGDAIPGFMDAMAMSYTVKPASDLRLLQPGDSISAEVVVVEPAAKSDDAAPDYWLEKVKVTAHAPSPPAKGANSMHFPEPGEAIPDFAFTNQNGQPTSFKKYRGKVLLVTFVYTRCPFPDFCPRVSGTFDEIYKQLGANPALGNARLLTISFDPEHDTPKVLRGYGFSVAHTHDAALFKRWEFAAPAAAELPKLADFFALTIQPDGGLITHNLSTTVIGPDGKIFRWYRGSDWQASDLIKDATDAQAPRG